MRAVRSIFSKTTTPRYGLLDEESGSISNFSDFSDYKPSSASPNGSVRSALSFGSQSSMSWDDMVVNALTPLPINEARNFHSNRLIDDDTGSILSATDSGLGDFNHPDGMRTSSKLTQGNDFEEDKIPLPTQDRGKPFESALIAPDRSKVVSNIMGRTLEKPAKIIRNVDQYQMLQTAAERKQTTTINKPYTVNAVATMAIAASVAAATIAGAKIAGGTAIAAKGHQALQIAKDRTDAMGAVDLQPVQEDQVTPPAPVTTELVATSELAVEVKEKLEISDSNVRPLPSILQNFSLGISNLIFKPHLVRRFDYNTVTAPGTLLTISPGKFFSLIPKDLHNFLIANYGSIDAACVIDVIVYATEFENGILKAWFDTTKQMDQSMSDAGDITITQSPEPLQLSKGRYIFCNRPRKVSFGLCPPAWMGTFVSANSSMYRSPRNPFRPLVYNERAWFHLDAVTQAMSDSNIGVEVWITLNKFEPEDLLMVADGVVYDTVAQATMFSPFEKLNNNVEVKYFNGEVGSANPNTFFTRDIQFNGIRRKPDEYTSYYAHNVRFDYSLTIEMIAPRHHRAILQVAFSKTTGTIGVNADNATYLQNIDTTNTPRFTVKVPYWVPQPFIGKDEYLGKIAVTILSYKDTAEDTNFSIILSENISNLQCYQYNQDFVIDATIHTVALGDEGVTNRNVPYVTYFSEQYAEQIINVKETNVPANATMADPVIQDLPFTLYRPEADYVIHPIPNLGGASRPTPLLVQDLGPVSLDETISKPQFVYNFQIEANSEGIIEMGSMYDIFYNTPANAFTPVYDGNYDTVVSSNLFPGGSYIVSGVGEDGDPFTTTMDIIPTPLKLATKHYRWWRGETILEAMVNGHTAMSGLGRLVFVPDAMRNSITYNTAKNLPGTNFSVDSARAVSCVAPWMGNEPVKLLPNDPMDISYAHFDESDANPDYDAVIAYFYGANQAPLLDDLFTNGTFRFIALTNICLPFNQSSLTLALTYAPGKNFSFGGPLDTPVYPYKSIEEPNLLGDTRRNFLARRKQLFPNF